MRRWLLVLGLLLLPALCVAQAIQPLPFRDRAEEMMFRRIRRVGDKAQALRLSTVGDARIKHRDIA